MSGSKASGALAKVLRVGGAQVASIGLNRVAKSLNQTRHRVVLSELARTMGSQLDEVTASLQDRTHERATDATPPAWMLWWDGFSTAPEIVRACVRSVEANLPDHRLVLVDSSNFESHTEIDGHLLDAFRAGSFSKTHFSDIIRMNLLKNSGGLWVDSTVFVPKRLRIEHVANEVTTRRGAAESIASNVSQQRWAGYFMGGRAGHPIWSFMDSFFAIYWRTHRELINYHLIDYGIAECYERDVGGAREIIDSVPVSSPDVHLLAPLLSAPHGARAQSLVSTGRNEIFKLHWRSIGETGPGTTHDWIVSDGWRH